MKNIIYADNAATTKLDVDAFDAMKPYLLEEYGNPSQPYSFSQKTKAALRESRSTIAECINAFPEEIYFTSGGTESDNWALRGGITCCKDKNVLITSQIEHHAVLNNCKILEKYGYKSICLPVDKAGVVELKSMTEAIDSKVGLVSIMLVNNEVGSVQNIKALANIAHQNGALFHTDAVQAMGHMPIDVKALNVDMLSASAHKFGGPRGVGFLYIKKDIAINSIMKGGTQEFNQRAGTENIPAIVGMATALKKSFLNRDINYINNLEKVLLQTLQENGLVAGDDFLINGSMGNRMPGILSLSFAGKDGEMILHRMDLMGIMISTGAACNSVCTQISHVLRAMKLDEKFAKGTIRISLNMENTIEEAKRIGYALTKIVDKKLNL